MSTSRGSQAAVVTERHRPHHITVRQLFLYLPGFGFPNARKAINPHYQPLIIRAEGDRSMNHVIVLCFQALKFLVTGGVPHFQFPIDALGYKPLSIVTVGHGQESVTVSLPCFGCWT